LDEQAGRYSFYHTTLPEFLTAPDTRANPRYQEVAIDPAKYHKRISQHYWRFRDNWAHCDRYGFNHLPSHAFQAGMANEDNAFQILYGLAGTGYFSAKINRLRSPASVDGDFKLIFQACQLEKQIGKLARFAAERILLLNSANSVAFKGVPGLLLAQEGASQYHDLITRFLGESTLVGDALSRAHVLMDLLDELTAAGVVDERLASLPKMIWHDITLAPAGDARSYQAIQLLRSMRSQPSMDEELLASILADFHDLDTDFYASRIAAAQVYAEHQNLHAARTMLEAALDANYIDNPGEFLRISSLLEIDEIHRLLDTLTIDTGDLFHREWPTAKVSDQQLATFAAVTIGLLALAGDEKRANSLLKEAVTKYQTPRTELQEWVRELCLSRLAETIPFFKDEGQASVAWEQLNLLLGSLQR
jgi:hypothetical protein